MALNYCVTVIVSVAVWLTVLPPPADAETETLVVPIGVPGFPVLLLPPPLHEVSADTANRQSSKLKSHSPRTFRLPRHEIPSSIASTGNKTA
jgi:hypothetical protein